MAINTKTYLAGPVAELPPGTCRSVETERGWIAIYNVEGRLYATDDVCPHAGGPLGEGRLSGDCVVCPWHGWRFNVRTGQRPENPDFCVECFEVKVEDGQIVVELPVDRRPF